ncbi:MAG TPA: ABC transporter permease [Planctomycetota bacterium]
MSYWSLVWQQFRKRTEALVGLFLLGALFLLALTAPLLANGLPWLVSEDGRRSSPLLKDFFLPLNPLDRFYNYVLIVLVLTALFALLTRLLTPAFFARIRRTQYALGALASLVLLLGIGTSIGGENVTTDFRALKKQQPQTTVVLTLVPYGALDGDPSRNIQPPDSEHPLGCDNNGFDVLARIIHGSRISLAVGFLAIGLAVLIGIFVGSLSGYFGGWVDLLLSRVIEVFICFPTLFLILTIIAIAPTRSIFWVMFAIGLAGWMGVARLIRGEVLKIRQLDYVIAARAMGMQNRRIVFRHILPNALAPVLVAATFGVAGAILAETSLGFLGLGVEPPTPSWGELLNQARQNPVRLWWLTIYPGFMIFLSVTLMNLVGEGLRDAMDPRLRR